MNDNELLKSIENIIDKRNEKMAQMIQKSFVDVEERLGSRIGGVETKVDSLGSKVGSLETKVDSLEKQVRQTNINVASLEIGQEEIKHKLDRVAMKHEVEDFEKKQDSRITAVELKVGLKTA